MNIRKIRLKNLITNWILALVLILMIGAFFSPTVNQIFAVIVIVFGFILYREVIRSLKPTMSSSEKISGDSMVTPQSQANIPMAEAAGRAFKKMKFGVAGAVIGFGVGYMTRPSFLGLKLEFAALYNASYAPTVAIQSDFRIHMLVATVIGFFAAFILKKMMRSK
jgi:hypothetical protein